MSIEVVGLNHTTAPVALRERLYVSGAARQHLLATLSGLPSIAEVVIVSTCNRTEAYFCGEHADQLIEVFALHAQVLAADLRSHLYLYSGDDAVRQLFRVACGLDSLVIGETQILGQIRDALEVAQAAGTAGSRLRCVFQQAIGAGKRARSETAISAGAFSVGRAAVDFARTLFPQLDGSPVLILGAGKMAELTARHLAAGGVRTVLVANRTHAHAEELAARLGGRAIHYAELETVLTDIDILISSTSAPHTILHADDLTRVMARRHGRALCLIDIAMPRDIDPGAAELDGVHLYNIDDLRAVTEDVRHLREAVIPLVEAIIDGEIERWKLRQAGMDAGQIISAMHESCDRIRRAELDRIAHVLATLTPEQREAVEYLSSSLVQKILHVPTVRLKEAFARHEEPLPLALLSQLFDLSKEEQS